MAPLEPWQRVWIDADTYSTDVHAQINCTDCHSGQTVEDMQTAHTGMVDSPAADAQLTCGSCHPDNTPANLNSLHTTLRGYDTVLYQRSAPENHATLEGMEQNHCNSCHTTCGDCHVSQPNSVGGGLLKGHTFVETPPMSQTCTACHGSRVKNEYFGLNESIPSDAHFRARMACSDCHTSSELHGVNLIADHRYDGVQGPTCESCHQTQIGVGSSIAQHEVHGTELLACQTCHSTTYTNCVNCHVEKNEGDLAFYTVEVHFMDFLIGRNPIQNAQRPYRYVPVRHVPIDIDSFSFYGANLLTNFSSRPTWVYTTPHNIQRITSQSQSCESCHGNDSVFLTVDKVDEAERAANQSVIVDGAPPMPEGYVSPTPAVTPLPTEDDSFWGSESATTTPAGDDAFWGDTSSSPVSPTAGDDAFWGEPTSEPTESTSDDAFWGN